MTVIPNPRHMTQLPESERVNIERAAAASGFPVFARTGCGITRGNILVETNWPERDHLPFWKAWRKARGDE